MRGITVRRVKPTNLQGPSSLPTEPLFHETGDRPSQRLDRAETALTTRRSESVMIGSSNQISSATSGNDAVMADAGKGVTAEQPTIGDGQAALERSRTTVDGVQSDDGSPTLTWVGTLAI